MTGSTNVHEIADGIYRISTPLPVDVVPGGFTFNQYLVVDEEGACPADTLETAVLRPGEPEPVADDVQKHRVAVRGHRSSRPIHGEGEFAGRPTRPIAADCVASHRAIVDVGVRSGLAAPEPRHPAAAPGCGARLPRSSGRVSLSRLAARDERLG